MQVFGFLGAFASATKVAARCQPESTNDTGLTDLSTVALSEVSTRACLSLTMETVRRPDSRRHLRFWAPIRRKCSQPLAGGFP